MHEVAEFFKVSFDQFLRDSKKVGFTDNETNSEIIKLVWENIKLPTRATKGSAGYDFYLPYSFSVASNKEATIPTGIRAKIQPGWMLLLVPRSSLGTKHGMRLVNTTAVVDSDYYCAENEGHIFVKLTVTHNMCLQEGDRFIQGLLVEHGITKNDNILNDERTGGFGSTGK